MGKYRVLVSCSLGRSALERLGADPSVEIVVEEIGDEARLAEVIPGFHALIVRSNVKVSKAVLEVADELLVVGRAGIGVDNIDVAAATGLGIGVLNAPAGNIVTTAEHTFALLMSLSRNIPAANASMKADKWEKKKFIGREMRSKTLGVVGLGRVGTVVAGLARGIGMKVVAFDPLLSPKRAAELGVEQCSFEELLAFADYITLHTPLTEKTRGMIGRDALSRVKPSVMIVNCSRGGVIDLDALFEAIEGGRVAGAALDVFEVEPPAHHPVFDRDEVVLTPHLGASTVEAQEGVATEVADGVLEYLATQSAPSLINAPAASAKAMEALGPIIMLAEKLGRFLSQVADGPIDEVKLTLWGEEGAESGDGGDLVGSALLKGLMILRLGQRVNLVNAKQLALESALKLKLVLTTEVCDFSHMISVEASGAWGSYLLEGALMGHGEPRIVRLDGSRLDALPEGNLILTYNDDVPGVIGSLGTCLGDHGVNIARYYNGRTSVGGAAVNLINVDQKVGEDVLRSLAELSHVQSVRQIIL
jgi:D-3-phosphoglycerate dehydrogenase